MTPELFAAIVLALTGIVLLALSIRLDRYASACLDRALEHLAEAMRHSAARHLEVCPRCGYDPTLRDPTPEDIEAIEREED